MRALAIAVALVASGAYAAEPTDQIYRAQGTDPHWTLTIDGTKLRLERPGKGEFAVEATPSDHEGNTHYESALLDVDIMPGACTDNATGKRWSDAVFLYLSGEELGGCGGAEIPADSLDGTSWHFTEIGGEDTGLTGDIFKDDRYAIDFEPDSFMGYTGCNRFSGGYAQENGVLTAKPPFGMTKRACPDPIGSRERKLIEILNGPARIDFPDAKTMVLTGDAGVLKLKRSVTD